MSISVTEIASQLKAHFEQAENDAKTFLSTHAPALASLAEKIEADPLAQLVMGEVVPAELRAPLAKVVQDFVDAYASKPAPAPAEPEAAVPADPAVPAA
jgi:hypothetical protein